MCMMSDSKDNIQRIGLPEYIRSIIYPNGDISKAIVNYNAYTGKLCTKFIPPWYPSNIFHSDGTRVLPSEMVVSGTPTGYVMRLGQSDFWKKWDSTVSITRYKPA